MFCLGGEAGFTTVLCKGLGRQIELEHGTPYKRDTGGDRESRGGVGGGGGQTVRVLVRTGWPSFVVCLLQPTHHLLLLNHHLLPQAVSRVVAAHSPSTLVVVDGVCSVGGEDLRVSGAGN